MVEKCGRTLLDYKDGMAWETFKKQFLCKFAPKHVVTQKQIEFKQLRQGDIIVAEYIHQFSKLSRSTQEPINTEAKKTA